LLGQTWELKATKGKEIAEIEGFVDDYAVNDNDLFGLDSLFTKFVL